MQTKGMSGLHSYSASANASCSKKIISKLLKPYKRALENRDVTLKEGTVQSRISQAKAKGITPKDLMDQYFGSSSKSANSKGKAKQMHSPPPDDSDIDDAMFDGDTAAEVIPKVVARVYASYQGVLEDNNSLDFDDLLVYGVRLFKENSKVASWCHHILVDEL